jgi:hypothetical protein
MSKSQSAFSALDSFFFQKSITVLHDLALQRILLSFNPVYAVHTTEIARHLPQTRNSEFQGKLYISQATSPARSKLFWPGAS